MGVCVRVVVVLGAVFVVLVSYSLLGLSCSSFYKVLAIAFCDASPKFSDSILERAELASTEGDV